MAPRHPTPPAADSNRFADLYDRAVETLLERPVESTRVETRYGETHALLMGDPSNPPLVVFQGGNVTNPVTLSWFQSLADEYHLIAPDTVGEPGLSADPSGTVDYGAWATDLLDGFGDDSVAMVGPSHGGGVALEAAAVAPERVSAVALVVPAGLGLSLSPSLARVVLASLGYRAVSRRRLLEWALAGLCTDPVADLPSIVVDTIALALRVGDLEAGFPGPDAPAALSGFDAPVLVASAARDPFFPSPLLRERLPTWLPSTDRHVVFRSERHFLSADAQRTTSEHVRSFLAAEYARAER